MARRIKGDTFKKRHVPVFLLHFLELQPNNGA